MNDSEKSELRQLIRDTVYEVIEPFMARLATDQAETQRRLDHMEKRLDRLEQRLDRLEQRLDRLEQRLDRLEQRGTGLERQMEHVRDKLHELDQRVTSLEQHLVEKGMVAPEAVARERWATFSELRQVELRVTQLEAAVFSSKVEAKGL